jgi:hypothetical protein
MDNKNKAIPNSTDITSTILQAIGMLLLLSAALDVLPVSDNTVIFLSLACFIIAGVIRRISRAI